MKKLILALAILMLVASAQAKVLTAKSGMFIRYKSKKLTEASFTVCEPNVTVKYNPQTDRGVIQYGKACRSSDTSYYAFIRMYDADGFQINIHVREEHFTSGLVYNIKNTTLTWSERQSVRRISVELISYDGFDENATDSANFASTSYKALMEPTCRNGRVVSEDDPFTCERVCDDNHIYNSETDKCDDLYDSKETAELVLDDNGNVPSSPIYTNEYPDQSGEWCQKANGEWYFDNNVKDGKCPKVKVRKDPERESAYGNELSEKTHCPSSWQDENGSCKPGWDTEAPSPWYSQVNAQWYCDYPYRHDGQGHCVL